MRDIKLIARELLDAYDHGKVIATPSARDPQFDWNAAYAVAAEIIRLRRARGERCAGRKIGFTNRISGLNTARHPRSGRLSMTAHSLTQREIKLRSLCAAASHQRSNPKLHSS